MAASASATSPSSYGRGARVLSIGIATTGLVTFAFFAVASHVLSPADYKGISLLWSVLFIVTSVIYRPIEQLLSRTIAELRRCLGDDAHQPRYIETIPRRGYRLLQPVAAVAGEPSDDAWDALGEQFVANSDAKWYDVSGSIAQAMLNQVENPFETDDNTVAVDNPELQAVWAAVTSNIDQGLSTQLAQWGDDWVASFQNNGFATTMRTYTGPPVLVIDDVGITPFDRAQANAFFQVVNRRYENRSATIVTTTPTAKAMSVAVGMAQPLIVSGLLMFTSA